jgi:long-chain acyl-CoA synthetase
MDLGSHEDSAACCTLLFYQAFSKITTTPMRTSVKAPGLGDGILRRAAEAPERVALREIESGREMTFGDLLAAVRRAEQSLNDAAIGHGARVAVCLPNSIEWIVVVNALWLSGATPVLINHTLPGPEVESLATTAQARMVLTEVDRSDMSVPVAHIDVSGRLTLPAERITTPLLKPQGCIIFTSGTEGTPKAAVLSHKGLLAATEEIASALRGRPGPYPIASEQSPPSFICLPLSHTGGLASLLVAIHVGRSILLARKFSTAMVAKAVAAFKLDTLVATPTMLHMLLEEPDLDLTPLRLVQSTGAPLAAPLQRRFEDRFHVRVIQNYGQTETMHVAGWSRDDLRAAVSKPGSVGRPYPGVELEIRDAGGKSLPIGEVGEITVRSPHLMAGYEGHAGSEEGDWIATGDLGYLDSEGFLFVVDRKREVIITGGFNVYPAELEELILEHPAVAEVAVVGVSDDRLGEVPKAYVVARKGATIQPAELIEFTRSKTAHFRALRQAEMVESLPTTVTEKVHRAKIRDRGRHQVHNIHP